MDGWCSDEKRDVLQEICDNENTCKVAEIGVYKGKSVIYMAQSLKKHGGLVYAIDPWTVKAVQQGYDNTDTNYKWWTKLDYSKTYNNFQENVQTYGVQETIVEVRGESQDVFDQFKDESLDLLHIDGNHSRLCSTRDVLLYFNKVKKGGYIMMDDTNWKTTFNAQRELLRLGAVEVKSCEGRPWALYKRNAV